MRKTIRFIIRCMFIPIIIPIAVVGVLIGFAGYVCNATYDAICGWLDDLSEKI